MKTRRFFSILATMLAVAVACEEAEPQEKPGDGPGTGGDDPNPPAVTSVLKVNATFADGFAWAAGDAVAFLQLDEDPIKSNVLTEGGATAEFSLDEEAVAGEYRIVYPYSDDLVYGVNTLAVPGNQTQTAAGEMNKANTLFFSTEDVEVSEDAAADVQFKMVGSVICFEVYGGAAGETVWSAGVTTTENFLAGELTVARDLTVTAVPDYNTSHVDLATAADAAVAENAAQKLYLVVLPAENVANPTYFVMTDKGKYVFYTDAAETFADGAMKTVKLNIAEADDFGASTEVLAVTVGETVYTYNVDEAGEAIPNAVLVDTEYDGAPVEYTLDAWVSGTAAEGESFWYEVKAYKSDWSVILEEYPTIAVAPEKVFREFTFDAPGTYYVYLYVKSGDSSNAQYAGVDITIVVKQAGAEINPPTAEMTSATEATTGTPYTLSITFADDSGLAGCWPQVEVCTADGYYPPVFANNYNGWWPALTVNEKSQTMELVIDFDKAGEYIVKITKDLKDINNNDAGALTLGTITVTGEDVEKEEDTTAPVITLKGAATAKVGQEYTLEIELTDEGGFKQCWPKVQMYQNFDPWGHLEDANTWWFELATGSTSYTFSKTVTPTAAGEYVVYVGVDDETNYPIVDLAGNKAVTGNLFTITVIE